MLLPGERRRLRVPIYRRDLLRAGNTIAGPAVVEEMDSTTLVVPRQRLTVDRYGSLWIREAP
jgi:N-methylhydantoinase A